MVYKLGIMIVVFSLIVGYYKYTQDKIDTLTSNNAKLEVANQVNTETINKLEQHSKEVEIANKELSSNLKKAEVYNDELRTALQTHNLTVLAKKKPGLIQERINDASEKLLTDIADDTSN